MSRIMRGQRLTLAEIARALRSLRHLQRGDGCVGLAETSKSRRDKRGQPFVQALASVPGSGDTSEPF
jgi:hypothetical protein